MSWRKPLVVLLVLAIIAAAVLVVAGVRVGTKGGLGLLANPHPVWVPFLGLLLGKVLRHILPYLTSALETIAEKEDWRAWPRFNPSYLAMFLLGVIGFGVYLAITPGGYAQFITWKFVQAVGLGYSGDDVARQGIKVYDAIRRISQNGSP